MYTHTHNSVHCFKGKRRPRYGRGKDKKGVRDVGFKSVIVR